MPTTARTAEFHEFALLKPIADALAEAGHGRKSEIMGRACTSLNITPQTLYARLKKLGYATGRKRRSDAGVTSLARDEAVIIAAMMEETRRANGKATLTAEDCIVILRESGRIAAQRVDEATGEVTDLSVSAIMRALETYGLDRAALSKPAPHTELRALHPNHVWQIDFSICVLFYLKEGRGMGIMRDSEFYKGKPANFLKVESDRVQRVVICDRCSGAIYVSYAFGGETSMTAVETLIAAMIGEPGSPLCGVPYLIYTDQGSAFKGAPFKSLLRRALIEDRLHAPENPRATGAVEKAQDIVERRFEGRLGVGVRVESLAQLNDSATRFRLWFNSTQKHSRHGMTRYAAWQRITDQQLRMPPTIDVLRSLATAAPQIRTVDGSFKLRHDNKFYSLRDVPGLTDTLRVGDKIEVCANPYAPEHLIVIQPQLDGSEKHYTLAPTIVDQWGQDMSAPVIGESYATAPDTQTERNKKEMRRVAYDEATQETADKAAKDKERLPFADVDALAPMVAADVSYLRRKGEALDVVSPTVVAPAARVLTTFEAAQDMRARDPDLWTGDAYARLSELYPDGVPEDQLDAAYNRALRRGMSLAVVNQS